MPSTASPEIETIDAIALFQEKLGIDEEAAISLAGIRVRCTAPGRTDESSLGDFITRTSDQSAKHDASVILEDIAAEVRQENVSHDQAVVNVLGKRAVIRDEETGQLARVIPPESKKK